MVEKPNVTLLQHLILAAKKLLSRGNGRLVWGCILGTLAACVYNFLFINEDIALLSERSWSEEKATYGIRLFTTRVVIGALLGVALGAAVDVRHAMRSRKRVRHQRSDRSSSNPK